MKHWLVTHADGDQTLHCTNGDDPSAEGIPTGERCMEVPPPDHDRQVFDEKKGCWRDCPKKQAAHEHALRRALSHAELVERLLALEERVASLADESQQERREPVSSVKKG